MLRRVAREAIGDYLPEAQTSWKAASEYYQAENPPLEPTVALVVDAGYLDFTVSYIIDYHKRTAMKDQLFTKIIDEVLNSEGRLEWAPQATAPATQPPPPPATIDAPPPSPARSSAKAAD